MSIEIIYFFLLLLIIFLLFNTIKNNIKYSPKKIKLYISTVLLISIVSYISILVLPFLKSQGVVLYFTPTVYLRYLSILFMLVPILYVFLKKPNINFNLSYIIMVSLTVIYVGINILLKPYLFISQNYGFVINLYQEDNFIIGYMIMLGAFLFFSANKISTQYGNKKGIYGVIITIIILIVELTLKIIGIYPFPYTLVGDLLIVLLLNYCINGFKKSKS